MKVELQEISKVIMGQSPKGESYNEDGIGLPLLNGAADYKGNIFKPKKYTSEPTRVAQKGDILLGIRATIGNFAFSDSEYCIGRGVAAIRVDEKKAHKAYILKCVERELSRIIHRAAGSTIKGIKKEDLTQMKLNLPSLDQQKNIAAILDAADAYRQKTKALIEKYDELTQSLFLDMFGDPVSNPKGWEKVATITYCDCIVPGRDKPKSFSGETPWITTADLNHLGYTIKSRSDIGLNDGEISEVRARVIPKESVIMTCVGDLGVVSINTTDIVMNQQLHAFICNDKLNNVFLMHNLSYQTPYMNKMASSTTVSYMNKTVANNTPTIVPPIELQNQFTERVQEIEAQKAQAQESLAKAEDLFNSLLQKAFKGELT